MFLDRARKNMERTFFLCVSQLIFVPQLSIIDRGGASLLRKFSSPTFSGF